MSFRKCLGPLLSSLLILIPLRVCDAAAGQDDSANALSVAEVKHTYMPKEGYVPDASTAIAIAVAVWGPIYGKDHIAGERPYKATLAGGVWTVEGSLPRGLFGRMMKGGVAVAEIRKRDACVLRVSHGK